SIIENTVQVLKRLLPDSTIMIQNGDYSEADMHRLEKNNFSKHLADEYYGSFFPKVFTKPPQRRAAALWGLFRNLMVSFSLHLSTSLSRGSRPPLPLLIPKRHRKAFKAISACDLVVVKGGSYIYSFGGFKQLLFIYRMLFTARIALRLKKPVVFLGHSIGPSQGFLMTSLIKNVLKRADHILVRENISRDFVLKDMGISPEQVTLAPDLAFLATKSSEEERKLALDQICMEEGISGVSNADMLVGITVRDWSFPGKKDPACLKANYLRVIAESIDFLQEKYQAKILFIPHCLDDLDTVEAVYALVQEKSKVFVLRQDYPSGTLRKFMGCLHFLIGTRIHSTIFAMSQHVPVIAVAYEIHKGFGILDMAGLRDYVIDIAEIRTETLAERIESLLENHTIIAQELSATMTRLQSSLEETISSVLSGVDPRA
ncbi:MAG: polysaccharide pyruvyl transferase family protein, partial [Anaerolineales bacterium]